MARPPLPARARVDAVAAREPAMRALADGELRASADVLRARARAGEALDDLLVDTFALVREAARRALGERPFDEQIAGGIALGCLGEGKGRVVEMQTGEGKTLTAVAPVLLQSLLGRGAHVLTFNDYLARRDAAWMGPIYALLGASVGHLQETMTVAERQRAYSCDVTYLTAKEAGFDLLRDGLCTASGEQVHRPFHFALVDEADSILIDEARIPLVIAGAVAGERAGSGRLAEVARQLTPGLDYDTDEHRRNVFLTEAGSERAEALLGCANLFAAENTPLLAALRHALHAQHLLHRDVDYIVRRGAVEVVDELTGRVAERRQWPDGLQAAIEAKEGLRLGTDGRLLGAITLQHFLRLYPRLAGMTATAAPAADELREVYGLEVVVVPTHRPCVRVDRSPAIYTHGAARDAALADEVARAHAAGRPVLVGTASVAESERLAAHLRDAGVPCAVLNARQDEREASIVAGAGAPGAVTISTNMAGRGTDIRLGGRDGAQRERVVALGGLLVLGTTLHESTRIDRQLRGRAGRQGDPGSSQLLVALDDELLQRYGIGELLPKQLRLEPVATPIESPLVRREVLRAQRIAEGECREARQRLYRYSEMLETQRRYVAEWRQSLVAGEAELELLAERAARRREELSVKAGAERGEGVAREVERRLTLLAIDRCWSEYLTEMQDVRDEVHLVALDGREPIAEFTRTAMAAFTVLLARIEDEVVEAFTGATLTTDGIDWEAVGLRGPSATWTYLVNDRIFGNNVLLTLSNRASLGLWGVLLLWPLLFAWGLHLHWQRWRQRSRAAAGR
jgi:preprotein translocase subunit SecA